MRYYKYVGSQKDADAFGDPKPIVGKIYNEGEMISGAYVSFFASETSTANLRNEWKEVSEEEYGQQQACKKISELTGRSEESIMEDVQRMCSEAFKPELEKELENKIVEAYRKVDVTKDVNTVWGDNNTGRYVSLEELVNKRDNPDKVSSPPHYNQGKIECIDAIESATINKSGFEGALVGNVIKYLWRYEEKGDKLTDIKKALWYLTKLKDHVESND